MSEGRLLSVTHSQLEWSVGVLTIMGTVLPHFEHVSDKLHEWCVTVLDIGRNITYNKPNTKNCILAIYLLQK